MSLWFHAEFSPKKLCSVKLYKANFDQYRIPASYRGAVDRSSRIDDSPEADDGRVEELLTPLHPLEEASPEAKH